MTDPLIISETTPDESLEPCSLLERWESEEGFDYLSFEEFVSMTTEAQAKQAQEAKPTLKLKDVTVLNKPTSDSIGVMYMTQNALDNMQETIDRLAVRTMSNLLWIGIMTTAGDEAPHYDDVIKRCRAIAMSPESHLFVGFRSENDGSFRTPVSQGQMDKIVRNSADYLRDTGTLAVWGPVGVTPSMSHGAAYQEAHNGYVSWRDKNRRSQHVQEIASAVEAKEAAESLPMPW